MSEAAEKDRGFMSAAIDLAQRAWGATHPNPVVGAVLVHQGQIIAEGWHRESGLPHAEVEALRALGGPVPEGTTLYVTLEPCSTHGRTGACTEAILRSGICRVVVGALDPNPAHAGRGIEVLRSAGIPVETGVLGAACADLNLIFNHWIVSGTPLIAAKMALTLDGKFAAASGQARWITGPEARENVMHWRRYFPAIAVGAGTVLRDNPQLTSRVGERIFCPRRIILDGALRTLQGADLPGVYTDPFRASTVVVCLPSAEAGLKKRAASLGIELWELPAIGGHLDWKALRKQLCRSNVYGLYVETGPGLATAVIEQHLADYLFVYKAPKFIADAAAPGLGSKRETKHLSEGFELETVRHEVFGSDVLFRGFLK